MSALSLSGPWISSFDEVFVRVMNWSGLMSMLIYGGSGLFAALFVVGRSPTSDKDTTKKRRRLLGWITLGFGKVMVAGGGLLMGFIVGYVGGAVMGVISGVFVISGALLIPAFVPGVIGIAFALLIAFFCLGRGTGNLLTND